MQASESARRLKNREMLNILQAEEISLTWVKPTEGPHPAAPIHWQDMDLLIVISPPGIIPTTSRGESWLYSRGDTLVPEPELTQLDPVYPWYHLLSAIQSIHMDPTIERVAVCSTDQADMVWWNLLCERLAREATELAKATEDSNEKIVRTASNLWITALFPLEKW